jgi:hypothetical protein
MTTSKKILTVALAAVAITTASLAVTGDAFAKGGKGGGHEHGSWGRGFSSIVVIESSCYQWVRGLGKVYVCN